MKQIYKINNLVFNNSKTQFCLCYNDGIKTFNTNDFKLKYSSCNLGSISIATLMHELNIVIFVGSETNEIYSNKKIVIYDLTSQKNIYSTPFQNEIKSLKTVNKYLIIGFQMELKIFSLEKKDTIIPIKEIPLPESEFYEIWDKSSSDIMTLTKIYLAYPFEKEICIISFMGNDWYLDKKKDIKTSISNIQSLFYVEKLSQIFIADEMATYIYGINPYDGKQKSRLYRGIKKGIITSITLLNKTYLAVNILNFGIQIFDLSDNNSINIRSLIGGFFYGDYISSYMDIKYDNFIEDKEGEFYEYDFLKKGSIIAGEDDGIELDIIAYNGFAYKLRIYFLKKEFDIILKEKYSNDNINLTDEDDILKSDTDIYISYKSIFDKDKKNKKVNEEKFAIYQ